MEDGFVTAEIAAKRLKITADAVRHLCRKKRIPGVEQRYGRIWFIPEASLLLPEVKKRKAGRPRKEKGK